ncbi:hypothetical protein FKW77_007134 [Venturia effusa]|uniref:Uncharacterized protein n=1 Tax=Venturia effusa TaxID=50376 RepID=A0A517KZN4_9PEZI|nr:hypothetical protein FKW77_007134 [Venturia effusa]
MPLLARSEWMEDSKHALIMAPGKAFEVIQTPNGHSVFFSLGTDNVFYATQEAQASKTGWNRLNVSKGLVDAFPGGGASVKQFVVAQNQRTLAFDIALVLTTSSGDHLYLSAGNANTDEFWSRSPNWLDLKWISVAHDSTGRDKDKVRIESVQLMNQPSSDDINGSQTCFVDVLQGTPESNTQRLLDRYYINLDEAVKWRKQTLPIDLKAGSIVNAIGFPDGHFVGGMYTYGKIMSKAEIIYGPAFNVFNPSVPPNPIRLKASESTTSIASALNAQGRSVLFFSAEHGISVFAANNQKESSVASTILTLPITRSATQLSAETRAGITALYGVSIQGELFYTTCPAGHETSPEAWTTPMTLVSHVQSFAFFINAKAGNNTLFVLAEEKDVIQLTQDPLTKEWASRAVILPGTDINDVVRFDAFNTRITAQTNDGKPAVGQEVLVSAVSPIGVYVNGFYRVLDATAPFKATTDASGVVKICQPTQDSVAICYRVSLTSESSQWLDIDPAGKSKAKLAAIQSRGDLDKAQIRESEGTSRSLIPVGVSGADRDSAVAALQQLSKVSATLPADGSTLKGAPKAQDLENGGHTLFESKVATTNAPTTSTPAVLHVSVGDLFRSMLNTAWDGIKSFAIEVFNSIHRFVVQIGDKIYKAILDCVSAVSHAIEWVFNKIGVLIEDLKKWLGFIFNWKDIVRTHKVIKNVVTTYASHSISKIDVLQKDIGGVFDNLEDKLNAWAGLPAQNRTMGQLKESSKSKTSAVDDPQTNYIHDKAQSHLDDANVVSKIAEAAGEKLGALKEKFAEFVGLEKDAIFKVIDEIKTQIIEPFSTLTLTDILKKLAAIIGKLALETAKNVVHLTLELVKEVSTAVIDTLNAKIEIPILSSLYKKIADEDLSILDLICLAAAVPSTLLYKAITAENPFPDNDSTKALISATDFPAVQQVMSNDIAVYKKVVIVAEFVAMAGLFFEVIASVFKAKQVEAGEPHKVSDKLKEISTCVKLLVIMPNYIRPRSDSDAWFWKFDAILTDLAFLKTCLDTSEVGGEDIYGTVSPYIDYGISAAWLVPAIGKVVENHNQKSSTFTSLSADLAYDMAVMTAPIIWNPAMEKRTKLIIFAAGNVVILISAVVRVASAGLLHDGD